MKTFDEIVEILKEKISNEDYSDQISTFAYGDYDQSLLGLGEIIEVDHYGGEGEGNKWYSVFYFKDHDVYIKVNGWYSSYDGVDFYDGWNSLKEVKPKQVNITVYE